MVRRLASIAFVVPDYDEAIAWFRDALGFALRQDVDLGGGKRWVEVAPIGGEGASLILAKAADQRQRAAIGEAAGGRVAYFLETDDFQRDYEAFRRRGVRFLEAPRRESYGTVAVFADPFGGRWDLIEPARAEARR